MVILPQSLSIPKDVDSLLRRTTPLLMMSSLPSLATCSLVSLALGRLNTAETDVTLILGTAVATHALYHFSGLHHGDDLRMLQERGERTVMLLETYYTLYLFHSNDPHQPLIFLPQGVDGQYLFFISWMLSIN